MLQNGPRRICKNCRNNCNFSAATGLALSLKKLQVVDAEKIEAKYENGVLKLLVPKKRRSQAKAAKNDQNPLNKKSVMRRTFFNQIFF
jgi:Hsp20/alpha crystallin family